MLSLLVDIVETEPLLDKGKGLIYLTASIFEFEPTYHFYPQLLDINTCLWARLPWVGTIGIRQYVDGTMQNLKVKAERN